MQKVVGSSPIIRFSKSAGNGEFSCPQRHEYAQSAVEKSASSQPSKLGGASLSGPHRSERTTFALHPPRPQAWDMHGLEPPLTGGYMNGEPDPRVRKLEGV